MKRLRNFALQPDAARALRAAAALGVPLLVCHGLGRPASDALIAIAAQTVALQELRGPYRMQLGILVSITLMLALCAVLGVLSGASLLWATLGMGLVALLSGLWRQLSSEYGAGLGVACALLFLLGVSQPGDLAAALHLAALVGIGCAFAALLNIGLWPFRPQYPLRHAVAETWMAASDLLAAMRAPAGDPLSAQPISAAERELRATLDRTFLILGAASTRRHLALVAHLEEMRREVVHFSMRAIALYSAIETLRPRPDLARLLPLVDSLLKSLGDAARSVANTLLTHRADDFTSTEIRLRRCAHLLRVLEDELPAAPEDSAVSPLRLSLGQLKTLLPRTGAQLEQTLDSRTGRAGKFPSGLVDFPEGARRPWTGWLKWNRQLDPMLVRYSLRMAFLTMLAVALYKGLGIPRGYWMAFTIVVVLQPDYGSTRERAAHRTAGTLAGSVLASALLWVPMPVFLLDGLATAMTFCFAYFLRRHYGTAVFFITIMLVLVMETMSPLSLDFTLTRLLCTALGGILALLAALLFWPIWEREKFATLLSAAMRSNAAYLDAMVSWATAPDGRPPEDMLQTKRRAENANRFAAASLQRLLSEPGHRHENPQRAAALTTYNQRITRALTALAVHFEECGTRSNTRALCTTAHDLGGAIEAFALAVEQGYPAGALEKIDARLAKVEALLDQIQPPTDLKTDLIWTQIAKSVAELRAMTLALEPRPGI